MIVKSETCLVKLESEKCIYLGKCGIIMCCVMEKTLADCHGKEKQREWNFKQCSMNFEVVHFKLYERFTVERQRRIP